jgi:hypothetical protein
MTVHYSAVPELILLAKEYNVPLSWETVYLRGYHIGSELSLPVVGAFQISDEWPAELLEKVNELPGSTPTEALRYSLNLHLDLIERSRFISPSVPSKTNPPVWKATIDGSQLSPGES